MNVCRQKGITDYKLYPAGDPVILSILDMQWSLYAGYRAAIHANLLPKDTGKCPDGPLQRTRGNRPYLKNAFCWYANPLNVTEGSQWSEKLN